MQARLVLLAGGCGAMALGVALVAPAPVTATQKSVHDLPREELLAIIDQVVKAGRAKGNDGTGKPRGAPQAATSPSFWNWETPHVHPIELTPDGSTLLAVNTADGRLEVFSAAGADLVAVASIPVGVDPVTVRVRSNTEAWVCNHLSDSISIVDLPTRRVRATLSTGDEPCDVVFAGTPARAFVSVSQLNEVRVFDPSNLETAPIVLAIQGEDPRALATDGTRVYAAIFESGNNSTVIPETVVSSSANPYPGDANPPPNSGTSFNPPLTSGLPTPPKAGMIVRRQASDSTWRDDNNGNWSSSVSWGMHDQDVAIINASTLAITYAKGLMNANMALGIGPAGRVTVVGTDATNHVRFEPRLRGTFVRVKMASFDPAAPTNPTILDLNPHLTYAVSSIPQPQRDLSIGDPRAIAWNAARTTGWIAGMGSNNLLVVGADGAPLSRIPVGQGPTGLALDEARGRIFVMNKFEGAISVVSIPSAAELSRTAFHDATPASVKSGRPFLYDTHATSGLGQASCASCHIDGRMDFLSWDLGDPSGSMKTFNQVCNFGLAGGCSNWHPMKGPMTTQTLVGIIGAEPLHWRGDREGLPQFNPAFAGLLGDDATLTDQQMQQFGAMLASMHFPPNPNRNIDNSLKTSLSNGGNPVTGQQIYMNNNVDGAATNCNICHTLPTGGLSVIISAALLQEPQSMKVPQLQNMHEKTGFLKSSTNNNRAIAFTHDGATDTLVTFLSLPVFSFASGAAGTQQRKDLEAFMFSLSTDTHAGVGAQSTLAAIASAPAGQVSLLNQYGSLADSGAVDLVAKGSPGAVARGWSYQGNGQWQSDRVTEVLTTSALRALAAAGSELTFTLVPSGSGSRIGIDRDEDGFLDRDEVDAGSDPADGSSTPNDCPADLNHDHSVDGFDLGVLLADWGCTSCASDLTGDGNVDGADLSVILGAWGMCP